MCEYDEKRKSEVEVRISQNKWICYLESVTSNDPSIQFDYVWRDYESNNGIPTLARIRLSNKLTKWERE